MFFQQPVAPIPQFFSLQRLKAALCRLNSVKRENAARQYSGGFPSMNSLRYAE